MNASTSIVSFRNVTKSYDGHTLVVRTLDLEIRRGEFLTLLGPSGSGKTTCLMMLAGFESATSGEIVLDGRPVNSVPAHRRGIGMVFQNYALFPHMSVEENLAFPLQVRGLARTVIGEKVHDALEMVRLRGYERRRPNQLSGGQQQRVALARALVFDPKLVLMDEPLGALDKQLREHMQYEIRALHARLGVTFVYVTHDQAEALTMSDRIAVFHDGLIQQIAPPADLYERPANAFVAGFIGENNRMRGRIVGANGTTCRVALDGGPEITARLGDADGLGAPALISLRPERVRVGPAAAGLANRLRARIEEVIYHGDHVRLRLAVGRHDDFIAKLPNNGVTERYAAGDAVEVGCTADDCIALRP
jgi:putative spermidine/putrescine transport system ATP-binding protein